MQLGARRIRIVETIKERLEDLQVRWKNLRLDHVADALGCEIEWCIIGSHLDEGPLAGWDRILITGAVNEPPVAVLQTMAKGGSAIVPVIEDAGTMVQSVQRNEGGFMAQKMEIWIVYAFPEYAIECLCASESISVMERSSSIEEWGVDDAWKAANQDPTRDRLGP